MDAPVVELSRSFGEGVEGGRWPQEDAFQPYRERLDRLRGGTRLGVNFDDVWGISGTIVFGKAGHCSLLQLFDPFDLSLKAVADVDGETRVFSVEDVSLRASLKGVGMGFDEVFESVDSSVELSYLGHMIIFSLFDRLEQGFGDALQGVGVEVCTAVQDVSG